MNDKIIYVQWEQPIDGGPLRYHIYDDEATAIRYAGNALTFSDILDSWVTEYIPSRSITYQQGGWERRDLPWSLKGND